MTTQIISLHEYRANLTKLWKNAQENKIKYIVMVHAKPVFEVTPFGTQENIEWDGMDWCENGQVIPTKNDKTRYLKAMKDIENGVNIYNLEDVIKERGLIK